MKISTLLFCFLLFAAGKVFAQCNPFFQPSEGESWEYATYGSHNQLLGVITASHHLVTDTDQGWSMQMHYAYGDSTRSVLIEGNIQIDCIDGVVETEFSRLVSAEELKAATENQSAFNSEKISWPDSLKIGDKLKNASLILDAGNMKVSYNMTNRKVVSMDTLNLSIGTFVCYRVEFDLKVLGLMEKKYKGVDYVTERIGVIRSEYFDKNGVLTRYTQMTNFKGY